MPFSHHRFSSNTRNPGYQPTFPTPPRRSTQVLMSSPRRMPRICRWFFLDSWRGMGNRDKSSLQFKSSSIFTGRIRLRLPRITAPARLSTATISSRSLQIDHWVHGSISGNLARSNRLPHHGTILPAQLAAIICTDDRYLAEGSLSPSSRLRARRSTP